MAAIDPLTAGAVLLATAATDAVYVMFTSAVVARKRVPAATWSSVWYLLSSYAVISYTENWVYVAFAAIGSWLGAYASITFLHRPPAARRSGLRRSRLVLHQPVGTDTPRRSLLRKVSNACALIDRPRRMGPAHGRDDEGKK